MEISNLINAVQRTLDSWSVTLASNISTTINALVVAVVFYILAKIGQQIVNKAAKRSSTPRSLRLLLANTAKITIMVIGFVVILGVLGLSKAVTAALAGAGIIGIVLGFALQDVVANFVSGIILIFRKPFQEDDLIEVSDHLGTVQEINLRVTKILSLDGRMIYIPNQQVFEDNLINYSESGERRVEITCGVSYESNLKKARELAKESVLTLDFIDKDEHEVEVFYDEFDDSSINFTVRFWIDFSKQPDFLTGQSLAIETIKNAFDANDIEIPFPIRTLDFDDQENRKVQLDQTN